MIFFPYKDYNIMTYFSLIKNSCLKYFSTFVSFFSCLYMIVKHFLEQMLVCHVLRTSPPKIGVRRVIFFGFDYMLA